MKKEDFDDLTDHDKELLRNRRVTITGVVATNKMNGSVTSSTLTVTNGENRLYKDADLNIELKDNTVGEEHLKDNAVTTDKIADSNVT